MTIDTALLKYYRAVEEAFPPLGANVGADRVRTRFREVSEKFATPRPDGISVEQLSLPLEGRDLGARLYRPSATSDKPLPLVVYLHGGGWVIGDLDTHDLLTAHLALDANCAVVSVDYRLAPEHPFPAPVDDALDAVLWLAEHRHRLGFATDRLGVAGDSAGAHLAAVAARGANDRVAGLVSAQLLIYPVAGRRFDHASYVANANGPGLRTEEMKWFWDQFLSGTTPSTHDVRAYPLAEPFERTPARTLVLAAAYDPLYDDAREFARFLEANGARVELIDATDMTHGFGRLQAHSDAAAAWMRETARRFGAMLWAAR
jgi:acetyl esterase